MVNVNENIRFLRKKKGWTQEKFSKKIGIKRSLVGAYEEGRSDPRLNNLLKMCEVFKISLDNILKKDVTQLPEDQYLNTEDQNVKVLSITVDKFGEENIELINQKASAGYLNSYSDFEFIQNLPKFQLPFLNFSGTHRAFEIKGDSMLPLTSGSIVIGKYLEDLSYVRDGKTYILLTKEDGIVYKRVRTQENSLELISDNKEYDPYIISNYDILEIWEAIAFFSIDFPNPNNEYSSIKNHINNLYANLDDLKKKL
ncbi:MAG: transcriptional regulator [Flammeovirgaceae bacterium]|nr:transcriptional regulator [Flammeovirgaceae bacterium]|tara:strand:- start:328 stop:1092 length:765 start_codon:yes stop_codon:yes gene_type:complete